MKKIHIIGRVARALLKGDASTFERATMQRAMQSVTAQGVLPKYGQELLQRLESRSR